MKCRTVLLLLILVPVIANAKTYDSPELQELDTKP